MLQSKRPSLNDIETLLTKDLAAELSDLRKERFNLWIIPGFILGLAVVAAYLVFSSTRNKDAAIIVFAVISSFAVLLGSRQFKAYKLRFKSKVVSRLVNKFFPSLSYNPESFIDRDLYSESQLFNDSLSGYEGSDFFSGALGDVHFHFSELDCWYETTDGKGNRQRHEVFQGFFFVGDFKRNFNFRTTIHPDIAKNFLGTVIGKTIQHMVDGKKLVDLEDPEFEKLFVVTADDQVEARYILTPTFMEKIRHFRKSVGYNTHLCFVNGKMFLAIQTNDDFFSPHVLGKLIDRADIMKFVNMLLLMQDISADLLSHPQFADNKPKMPPLPSIAQKILKR